MDRTTEACKTSIMLASFIFCSLSNIHTVYYFTVVIMVVGLFALLMAIWSEKILKLDLRLPLSLKWMDEEVIHGIIITMPIFSATMMHFKTTQIGIEIVTGLLCIVCTYFILLIGAFSIFKKTGEESELL